MINNLEWRLVYFLQTNHMCIVDFEYYYNNSLWFRSPKSEDYNITSVAQQYHNIRRVVILCGVKSITNSVFIIVIIYRSLPNIKFTQTKSDQKHILTNSGISCQYSLSSWCAVLLLLHFMKGITFLWFG